MHANLQATREHRSPSYVIHTVLRCRPRSSVWCAAAKACAAWRATRPKIVARYKLPKHEMHLISDHTPRPQLLGLGAALAAAALAPAAKADLVNDLLEKSKANKADNDKKRLLSSYANVQRSRTVSDGSCAVPNNFLGCGGMLLLKTWSCPLEQKAAQQTTIVYRKPCVYQGQVYQ